MATQVVTFQVDDLTKVRFEVEPVEGFRPAGVGQIAGWVCDAVAPAVDAAKAVLDKVKEVSRDGIEVRFGVKGEPRAARAEAISAGSHAGSDAESGETRGPGADEE